ncbi:MAG: hypothetical protein L0Y58_10190 [Verrucomicrobia subdivision 3 bacterium]|nr:hypothetical protein [Limisphaerales bacterium]
MNTIENPFAAKRTLRDFRHVLLLCCLAVASFQGRGAVTDGLVFYAPFNSSSPDDVQGGKTGSLGGDPAFVSGGIIGDFVRLANDTVLPETYVYWDDPTPEFVNFSVQVWIRSTSLQNGQASGDPAIVANKNWGSGGNTGWVVAMGSSSGALGRFQWNFRAPPAARADFDPSAENTTVQDGTWHHLIVTHDRSGFATFYVDGVNVGQVSIATGAGFSLIPSVPNIFALGNDNSLNYENGNGTTANGDFDEVAVWDRTLFAGEVARIHTAGRAGTNILNIPEPTTPFVSEASPADGARGFSPEGNFRAVIVDASTQLDTASVKVYFDGSLVGHTLQGVNGTNTVTFTPPSLLAPLSMHEYRLEFSDNGSPVISRTNRYAFTVGAYLHLLLPAPIAFENFDEVSEASLPAGWTATNATTSITAGPNLDDPLSDSYLDWVVVSSNRFATVFDQRRLNVSLIVTNGRVVRNLISGNFAYAESDNRGGNQVQALFSPDYDLTGQTNVYLAFHSIYEQNQDSSASVEYSIDEGATWLPALYMMDRDDIIRDASGAIDAEATLNAPQGDGAYGQSYGTWIGAAISPALAPFISGRINDDAVESKRIEFLRLAQADNQSKVRLRFAQSGTASWYFGIDNVGLYSVSQVAPPSVIVTPANQTEAIGNDALFTPTISGVGPFTYQWGHNGANLPNQTNEALVLTNIRTNDAGAYSVVVGYLGGSTNSTVGMLTVIDPALALVTGQWDFNNFDLSATCGQPLEYTSVAVEFDTGFANSDFFDLPNLDGAPVSLMAFPGLPPSGGNMSGYRMRHGIAANGGGTNVNKYTLIMDVLYSTPSHNAERAILQTDPLNANNRDIAIGANNGIGVSGGFQGTFAADAWQRIAFAVDLNGPSGAPLMAKFINGVKVGQQVLTEGRDGRWSLPPATHPDTPWALLLADDNTDVQPGYVSSIQIRNDRLSDELIRRMGGPSRHKIPGCITITRATGNMVTIRWTGAVPLQQADSLTGPWSDVAGAASPHTVTASGTVPRFYRPKL